MAVTELRTLVGLDQGESAAAQCRQSRIRKDNRQMEALSQKIDDYCNPFADNVCDVFINLGTGQAASSTTETYLLNTLQRGKEAREQFQGEWSNDSSRFLKTVKRIRVQNFAAENVKKRRKTPTSEMPKKTAESLRDMFIRMIIIVSQNTSFDLRNILSYPITKYPLSLAHCDGTSVKSDKSSLLKKLESLQNETVTELELPSTYVCIYDGGLVLHSTLSQTKAGASYASIA